MNKRVTIHDLARELNIDSSTVSRALNNSPRVGETTKRNIFDLAKKLGYQRNLIASSLRTGGTKTIGVVVPYISGHFFSEVIDGIEEVASNKNYRVIIAQTKDNFEKEKNVLESMFKSRIEGLLISPSLKTYDRKYLNVFLDNEIPVVLFDRYYENAKINKVIIDDQKAAYLITEHLINNGCKNLIHITGDLDALIYKNRFQGFKEPLEDNGVPFNDKMVYNIKLLPEFVIEVIKDIIKGSSIMPDGIVCVNDAMALSIMKYLDTYTDIKVPDDLAISGFGNEPASSNIKPELTTIDQSSFKMGMKAAKILIESIECKDDFITRQTVFVPSKIIIRGSSARTVSLDESRRVI